MSTNAYAKVVGEPFLSKVESYKEEMFKAHLAWSDFARKVGATRLTKPLGGLGFDSKPEGWVHTGRGRYRPPQGITP